MNEQIKSDIFNEIIFSLNSKNKLITNEIIELTIKKYNLNYKIKNQKLFIQVFSHKSYCINVEYINKYNYIIDEFNKTYLNYKNIIPIQEISYERLEFLGDSILKPIITKYIYDRFPNQQEGFMSKLRTKIESTETLATFCKSLNFNEYILLSRELDEENNRINNKNILEDTFEAFIGALYIDGKNKDGYGYIYNLINNFIISLIENIIDISSLIVNEINYKEELIKFCHIKRYPDPIYGVVQIHKKYSKDNNKSYNLINYEMFVKVNNNIEGSGFGLSKKEGEQNAAKQALEKLSEDFQKNDDEENEYIIDD
jgi:ribonuclease-3